MRDKVLCIWTIILDKFGRLLEVVNNFNTIKEEIFLAFKRISSFQEEILNSISEFKIDGNQYICVLEHIKQMQDNLLGAKWL